MTKFLAFLFGTVLMLTGSQALATNVADFYANDAAIESLLEAAPGADLLQVDQQIAAATTALAAQAGSMDVLAPRGDNQIVAIVLAFFLGGLAIHRVYLGSTPLMILYYFITIFGIFGIVPFIDFIVLSINGTDSFLDRPKDFSY